MSAIVQHFWIVFILGIVANGLTWKWRSKKYIAENPGLQEGYDRLIKGYLIFGNIPWVIMGIGLVTGMTKSMSDFFNPGQLNPIVIAFLLVLIVEWMLGIYWIFFNGGAETLVKHPGLFTSSAKGNEKFETMKVKLLWIVAILGGLLGIAVMIWKMNVLVDTIS
jgi:hypothetical protein